MTKLEQLPEHVQQLVRETADDYHAWREKYLSVRTERALLHQKMQRLDAMGATTATIRDAFGIGWGTAAYLLHGETKQREDPEPGR